MKLERLLVAGLLGLVVGATANEIDWGTGTRRIYGADGLTALSTNVVAKASNTACFVQLIYAGLNNLPDTANITGTGSMIDDEVVAWTYIGASQPASQALSAGRFARFGVTFGYNNTSYANGSVFFIRAWELPALDFVAGTVPTNTLNYGNSQLFSVAGNGGTPTIDQFALTSNFSTTLTAIPEPGTIMIAVLGVGLMVGYRRIKYFRR